MLAVVFAVMLQQAAPGQVVWETPPPPPAEIAAAAELPPIPDSARTDPWGYERAECSPLIRKTEESMQACQARVRIALAAHLGDALPAGLAPTGTPDECRREAAGDRYALQCGAETRPRVQPQGGVAWTEECRPASGVRTDDEGLTIRLGGRD